MKGHLLLAVVLLLCAIRVHSQEDCNIDVVFVLDKSGSIGDGWKDILNFLISSANMIGQRSSNSHVGLVVFNDRPRTISELVVPDSDFQSKLEDIRDKQGPIGWTNSSGAIHMGGQVLNGAGSRSGIPKVILFFTDGRPTKGLPVDGKLLKVRDNDMTESGKQTRMIFFNQMKTEADKLKDNGVDKMVAVGITTNIDREELEKVFDELIYVNSTDRLMAQLTNVIDEVCDVSVDAPASTTTMTTSTTTPTTRNTPPALTGVCAADVVVLIDASGSIKKAKGGELNWDKVKNFTLQLVQSLDVGPNATHFSVIVYSYSSKVLFQLGALTKEEILDQIRKMPYLNSWTATTQAMETARTKVLTGDGNRDNAPDILLLITDGKPTVMKNGTTKDDNEVNPQKEAIIMREIVAEANALKKDNVKIVVVGVGDQVDTELMMLIADDDSFLMVDDFDQLGDTALGDVRDRTCITTTTTTTTTKTTTVTTTTLPPPPPVQTGCNIDLIILVDASGSIGPDNWKSVKTFLTNFLRALLRSQGEDLKVAVICFSDRVDVVLPFASASEDSITQAMAKLSYKGSYTATAEALETAIGIFRSGENRGAIANYVVLMTDGFPTQMMDRSQKLEKSEVVSNPDKKERFYDEVRQRADILKKELDVSIIGVAVTNTTDEDLLMDLTSNDKTDYFKVDDFDELGTEDFANQLETRTCQVFDPIQSDCRVDVAMVVDNSGSVSAEDIESIKDFLTNTLNLLFQRDPLAYSALVLFANAATLKFNLGELSQQEMKERIDKISTTMGYTASAAALQIVYNDIFNGKGNDRPNAADVMIYLTDGQPTKTLNLSLITESAPAYQRDFIIKENLNEANKLKDSGVSILSIGVTSYTNFTHLEEISGKAVFNVTQFSLLNDQLNDIIDATCQLGTTAPCSIDMAIVVDSSGSIGTDNWKLVKKFLQDLVLSIADVGITGAKIALINFSNKAELVFNLGTEDLKGAERVVEVIEDLTYKNSWTRTAEAMELVRTMVFHPSNETADRPDVPNILLLLTDGRPSMSKNGSVFVPDSDMSAAGEEKRQMIEAELIAQAQMLKDVGIAIVAVGITGQVNANALRKVVTDSSSDYFSVDDFDSLTRVRSRLRSAVCD